MNNIQFVSFKVLSTCNWDCNYCSVISGNHIHLPDIYDILYKIYEFIKHFHKKLGNCTYIINGGEPGLLPLKFFEELKQIKNKYNIHIRLNTNGTNFDKIYQLNVFDEYKIHCSKDLIYLNYIDKENCRNIVVISKYNIHNLETFINKYKNYDIDYFVDTYNLFNLKELQEIKNILKKYNKQSDVIDRYIKNSVMFKMKKDILIEKCKKSIRSLKIDLEYDLINVCCVDPYCMLKYEFETCEKIIDSKIYANCKKCYECNYLMNI